jgi:hypothetical protein
MGVKRLSRGKLLNTEKLGIEVDVGVSDAMKKALVSATQHREGYKVVTDLEFDFGASAAALKSQSVAVKDPIGPSGTDVSYLCKLTTATFGNISTIETICTEVLSDGTMSDFDLLYGNAAGYLGIDAGGANSNLSSEASADIASAVGLHRIMLGEFGATLADQHLYIVAGQASTKKASTTIDCSSATVANVLSGSTQIRLIDEAGDPYTIIADSSRAWDAAYAAGKFGTGPSVGSGTPAFDTKKRLAYSISTAIHSHGSFSTDATSRDVTGGGGSNNGATNNLEVVTVTQAKTATATADENKTNFFTDVAHSLSGIVVNNFSGGAPHDIASGKMLIRVTGFMEPDDL